MRSVNGRLDKTALNLSLGSSLDMRDKYPEGSRTVHKPRDWENRDNTSSATSTSRTVKRDDQLSTHSPSNRIVQSSRSSSTFDYSNFFLGITHPHPRLAMVYHGTFAGGAIYNQLHKCWSSYHEVGRLEKSLNAVVHSPTRQDMQPICPQPWVRLSDGRIVENSLTDDKQIEVSKSTQRPAVFILLTL